MKRVQVQARRYAIYLLMAAVISLLAAACGDSATPSPTAGSNGTPTSPGATGTPPLTGGTGTPKVLNVRFYDDPSGFDPATLFRVETENIAFNIYSGLVTYESASGEIIPDLAESWESTDQRVWTFHLREGVTWQGDYGELTSEDVLYSYDRILDPATGSPYAAELANVESVEAPDDYTVVVTLKQPDAGFLHQVANYHQGQIVKKEAVEAAGDNYKWEPVGTGPYMLDSFTPGSEIVLVRHEDYFRGPAPIERIRFIIIKDDQTAAIALRNGEVDLAMRIRQESALEPLLDDSRFTINVREAYGVVLKVFNTTIPELSDPRVRQAWAHAVDMEAIVETVQPITAIPADNILPPWMDGYSDDVPMYPYDPERAKELLAEAGYPDGFTITQLGTASNGVTESDQLEQAYLAQVGINLEFELVDTPVYNQRRNSGDFTISGRLLPAINPDTILFSYLHPDNTAPAGLNGARYDNPQVTDLLLEARAEGDPQRRQELYTEIQQIVLTDLPYLPGYAPHTHWPGYSWVTGVEISPLSQVNFYGVDILPH